MERRPRRRPPTGTTVGAALLILALGATFAYEGVQMIAAASGLSATDETNQRLVLAGIGRSEGGTLLVITGALVLVASVLEIVAGSGVLARRQWAREVAGFLALVFALLALGTSATGLTADPPAENAWVGMLAGLANVAVLVLLLLPSTGGDFATVEHERARRDHLRRRQRELERTKVGSMGR